MTTIITVVAIVALVFFVAISVAVFMIWKQETQMRTDSLKGIESSLNEVLGEFSQRRTYPDRGFEEMHQDHFERRGGKRNFLKKKGMRQIEFDDEIGEYERDDWDDREPGIDVTVFKPSEISAKRSESRSEAVKPAEMSKPAEEAEEPIADVPETDEPKEETPVIQDVPKAPEEKENTDKGSDNVDLSFIDIDDLFDLDEILFESTEHDRAADYNTGRSGKKYTAEELETLIKE